MKDYPPGCFGILSKVHHAAIDGASGADLATITQDLDPNAPPLPPPASPWRGERVPPSTELIARATWNNVARPVQSAVDLVRGGAMATAGAMSDAPAGWQRP